jgi:HD-like signal output (HDOD) protein
MPLKHMLTEIAPPKSRNMDKIDRLLDDVTGLPPAPQILPPLLQALGQENTDIQRVTDLISFDPSLTAQLLMICNSAYFGRAARVDTISEAVHRLGFQTTYRIAAGAAAGKLFPKSRLGAEDPSSNWWRSAVMTAFATQFVADDFNAEPGTMFTAGLLHDIGRTVLLQSYKMVYAGLLEEPGLTDAEIITRESSAFGMDHAEIGGRLLARWRFSSMIVNSVRGHDNPEKFPEGIYRHWAACLHLGVDLARSVDPEATNVALSSTEPTVSMKILNRSADDVARYQYLIKENMRFVEAMCRLN